MSTTTEAAAESIWQAMTSKRTEEVVAQIRRAPTAFADLSPELQRSNIRDHLRRYECDRGLLGEAINEHKQLARQIEAAFFANDREQLGVLVDLAFRQYLGGVIQQQTDDEAEQRALDEDGAPYCGACLAKSARFCKCGPIAANE